MCHPLKAFRNRNALTLQDLAHRLDASKGTLSAYENGKSLPQWPIIGRIYALTNGEVTPNDFMRHALHLLPEVAHTGSEHDTLAERTHGEHGVIPNPQPQRLTSAGGNHG